MLRTLPMLLLMLVVAPPALAGGGVLEINQACATGPGCFTGDAPGWPVTITVRGSYRLTGTLGFNSTLGPPSENFIEITADDVQLDLGGFSIRCSSLLTGTPCPTGPVVGIRVPIGADRVRIHDGTIFGMPGDGIGAESAQELQVEAVTVTSVGGDGIAAGSNARIERCTVTGNGEDGIDAESGAIVTQNVAEGNGQDGIAVWSHSIVSRNVSRNNGDIGIEASSGSIIEANTVASNQIGLGLSPTGGLARENVISSNTGFGMTQTTGTGGTGYVFRNNVLRGNNRGDANPQTDGGTDAGGNYCGGTLGCP